MGTLWRTIRDRQSSNLYSYVWNNPPVNNDPIGLAFVSVSHPDGSTGQVDNGDGQGCLDAGIAANYACAEGVCGTCETRVLEGIPDHRDQFLSREEQAANKTIMICCSGAKSPTLVLDL